MPESTKLLPYLSGKDRTCLDHWFVIASDEYALEVPLRYQTEIECVAYSAKESLTSFLSLFILPICTSAAFIGFYNGMILVECGCCLSSATALNCA